MKKPIIIPNGVYRAINFIEVSSEETDDEIVFRCKKVKKTNGIKDEL